MNMAIGKKSVDDLVASAKEMGKGKQNTPGYFVDTMDTSINGIRDLINASAQENYLDRHQDLLYRHKVTYEGHNFEAITGCPQFE